MVGVGKPTNTFRLYDLTIGSVKNSISKKPRFTKKWGSVIFFLYSWNCIKIWRILNTYCLCFVLFFFHTRLYLFSLAVIFVPSRCLFRSIWRKTSLNIYTGSEISIIFQFPVIILIDTVYNIPCLYGFSLQINYITKTTAFLPFG